MFRLFLLSLVFIGVYAFAEPKFPELTGRVVDEEGLLSKAQEQSLADMSGTIERDSTVQVVVVTLKSLDGYDIAEYGYQLARYWKVGQRDEDNGILIMIAPHEHKVRIEIGYGLEAFITDAEAYEIIQSKMLPRFKEKDVYVGIRDTIDAIGTIVSKEYQHDYVKSNPYSEYINSILYFSAFFGIALFFVWAENQKSKIQNSKTNRIVNGLFTGIVAGIVSWYFFTMLTVSLIVGVLFFTIGLFLDIRPRRDGDYGSGGGSFDSMDGNSFEIFKGSGGDFGGAGASADIGSVLDGLGSL
jgi:uncharacterized protein